ncbi:MAG: DUF4101 domain-containing protein [Cyanobacteria bacterium CRU_2_1]|nr:DUF4101 domain-containing protein [Cyanobacteria bacterium RU_5_0]NJR61178.1 DUF4101 domain-containing protein [Cyanobacteria bacterium CRU_2_1]
MRIPLDYYRILGLPIQATAEQLQQAHRDRTLQLPRREFSEAAIAARKQLIDQAYTVLSDPFHRQDYDASFLAKSYELLDMGQSLDSLSQEFADNRSTNEAIDPYTPNIEIPDELFVGALLILLELGEYELVLRLGNSYFHSNPSLRSGQFGNPEIISSDIVLTLSLACLELGREQWQQGQYENAAESLQIGQDLLLREGVFANLRGEMQADLFKLRPYRILELLAQPESQVAARRRGLELLEDMLHDRGGIDGTGEDESGLNVDDFLRFTQQLRGYLTATEQQALFEAEARRPSAVAIYLAVYALLARGFAQRQPALIRRAKGMLIRLGTRQDVHLEQAVCSLLLGQTEEASHALERSQEYESLDFIREHSQGAPDLLPGLCLYSERWLQNEVFPHFRDLSRKQASLKEYFADEDVQAYLEELPNEPESATPWAVSQPGTLHRQPVASEGRSRIDARHSLGRRSTRSSEPEFADNPATTATIAPDTSTAIPKTERVGQPSGESRNGSTPPPTTRGKRSSPPPDRRHPEAADSIHTADPAQKRRLPTHTIRLDRLIFLAAIGVFSVLLIGFLFSRLFGNRSQPAPTAGTPASQAQELAPILSEVVSEPETPIAPDAPLDTANAATLVQTWLSAKAAALGESHNTEQLSQILTEPALSDWQARAAQVEAGNSYWTYVHSGVEVTAVEANPDTPDEAQVEATVTEKGELYTNGQLDTSSSYDSTLQVRYTMVRAEGQWRIQSWEILE